MSDSSSSIRKILFLFFFPVTFFSCSQVSPELNFSTGSIIFEFENEEDFPSARLSVFLDMSSDEHRAESIKLESLSYGYVWEANSPLKFENGSRKYTGYTNFVMPGSESFPQGQYKVTYIDANEETAEISLNLVYNNAVSTMKAGEIPSYMKDSDNAENLVVYDGNGILVFYGQRQGEMSNMDFVWQRYPKADFARVVWVSAGSRTICLMPRIYKSKNENEESN